MRSSLEHGGKPVLSPHFRTRAVAFVTHAAILALPLVLVWDPSTFARDAGCLTLWALCSSLCMVDSSVLSHQASEARPLQLRNLSGEALSALSSLTLLCLFWSALAARLATLTATRGLSASLTVAGAALMVAGLTLRFLAIASLGSRFESEAEPRRAQGLRTTGLHSRLRHPSETGLALLAVGACLMGQGFTAPCLAFGLLLPLSWARLARENRALERAFGQVFARYRAEVPALLPRWRRRVPASGNDGV